MTLRDRFSANLLRQRRKTGMSQQRLGDLSGLHRTEISLLERSGREPRLGTLLKLAAALDCNVEDLCKGARWLPKSGRFSLRPGGRS